MKRHFAFLLAVIVLCGLLVVPAAAARDYVLSPEYSDSDKDPEPDPPVNPEDPVVPEDPEVPEEPVPGTPVVPEEPQPDSPAQPTSPQTGYSVGISSLVAVAVLSGAVAVISGKKLCKR